MEKEIRKKSRHKYQALLSIVSIGFFVLSVFPLAASASSPSPKDYIIKLSSNANPKVLDYVADKTQRLFEFSYDDNFKNIYALKSPFAKSEIEKELNGQFEYLEEEKPLNVADVYVNDPGFTSRAEDTDKQWGLAKTGFNQVWEKTTGSYNNIVAVIDTGIDETHEDLQAINFVEGFDFVSRQKITGRVNSDNNGHGTLVAGVLGATANNGLGITGTNWMTSLMPLKALDDRGKGESALISEAIVWAVDNGAKFINLSVGGVGFGHDTTLANAISYAFEKGAVIVSAAGNDTSSQGISLDDEPVYPICDDNNQNMVIGVTATDSNDLKPEFANYGKNCIDVAAPGKRILSTINYDPLTKKPAPNSYAYASGTSLAVPFVVGQAALIKSLHPEFTNVQIRDKILSTADPIDNLNISQCKGVSCKGMLGAGRINVKKSLESQTVAIALNEGDLVKMDSNNAVYQISGGQKRLVSTFVLNQQFSNAYIKPVTPDALANMPDGPYVTPKDGTLVKIENNPTVFYMSKGQKLPITYNVFKQRQLSFSNINTVSFSELNSWVTGSFLPPSEGTLVKTARNKTVYWVVGDALHAINYAFYVQKGLNIFPVLVLPDKDIAGFPKGETYLR